VPDLLSAPKQAVDQRLASTGQSDDVSLLVGGKLYGGWKEIRMTRSIRCLSGGFELSVSDKWGELKDAWQIVPGNECEVRVGKETLITGYVDRVSPSFSAEGRSISIAGRDKTADLVDSSAVHTPGGWQNISLSRLAAILAKPFGVSVTVDPLAASRANHLSAHPVRITNGESAFELLEKEARTAGVLLMTDGKGGILITMASSERAKTALVQGSNILEASADYDFKDRFSTYLVKSQLTTLTEGDTSVPEPSAKGSATDPEIKRYRPLLVIAETLATDALCRARAQWEAKSRVGKSVKIQASVATWRQIDGSLWKLNTVVSFESAWLGMKSDFLISGITFTKGSGGTIAHLTLEPRDAYSPDPTLRRDQLRDLVIQESRR
jgi:prophage tail gpP-like protein